MRARCYQQLGEQDKADYALEKALQINPDGKLVGLVAKENKVVNSKN